MHNFGFWFRVRLRTLPRAYLQRASARAPSQPFRAYPAPPCIQITIKIIQITIKLILIIIKLIEITITSSDFYQNPSVSPSSLPAFSRASRSALHSTCKYIQLEKTWEGYLESKRCSRDTYPESNITKYPSIRRLCYLER